MPTVFVKTGVQLFYEQYGAGPDLVLIGGLSADRLVRALVLEALAKHYRVLTFDNRGVGQSDAPPGPYTLAVMADDTAALMEALSIKHAAVVGHSMGGGIVLQLCLRHPALISRAVIAASAACLPLPSIWHIRSVIHMREASVDPVLITEMTLPWIFGSAFLADEIKVGIAAANLLNNPHPQSLEAFKSQAQACEEIDLRGRISEIATPTLIIAGREDLLTPAAYSEAMVRGIPGATLVTLDCGHMVQIERPEEFCRAVRAFVTA